MVWQDFNEFFDKTKSMAKVSVNKIKINGEEFFGPFYVYFDESGENDQIYVFDRFLLQYKIVKKEELEILDKE